LGLDNYLYNSLLEDIETITKQIQMILEQMQASNRIRPNGASADDKKFDYKTTLVGFQKMFEWNLFSEDTKRGILCLFLFGLGSIITQKSKMDEILNNEQVGGILFVMTAMGIEFSSISIIESIMQVIVKQCSNLKSDNLENCIYEATIYEIFNRLSGKMVSKELFAAILTKLIELRLTYLKNNLNSVDKRDNLPKKKKK
jgi:hypothetical protein